MYNGCIMEYERVRQCWHDYAFMVILWFIVVSLVVGYCLSLCSKLFTAGIPTLHAYLIDPPRTLTPNGGSLPRALVVPANTRWPYPHLAVFLN